ncbi:MAG: penicillin-binding transpeptidase domain-containing protein, partial [Solirubrobacteraceae bacterium]
RRVRVVSPEVADITTNAMRTVVSTGTGKRADYGGFAAGKTGTTENNADAWFVGFSKRLTVAVWVGYPDSGKPMETEYQGGPVEGGTYPAAIWGTFMGLAEGILTGREPEDAPEPEGDDVPVDDGEPTVPAGGAPTAGEGQAADAGSTGSGSTGSDGSTGSGSSSSGSSSGSPSSGSPGDGSGAGGSGTGSGADGTAPAPETGGGQGSGSGSGSGSGGGAGGGDSGGAVPLG